MVLFSYKDTRIHILFYNIFLMRCIIFLIKGKKDKLNLKALAILGKEELVAKFIFFVVLNKVLNKENEK